MATKTAKTLDVHCPKCGAGETITLDLNDMTACECGECSGEFSPQGALDDARERVAQWKAVVAWIESAPTK